MDQIGKRIKKKRESLGFQIKELSIKIGVTSSLISQIEKGKAFPSIVTLVKIAETLQTTVGELIGENENLVQHPLLKSNERRLAKKNKNGTSLYLLSYHDPSKQIEPYIIQFGKNSDSEGIMTSNYPGQEFCFVLKGRFEALINEKQYSLSEGDGFYFNSSKRHLFRNISGKEAEMLWIITPQNIL
ncbi:helix-turn-helix domain-containing protein [Bacteroidota bacterium]